MVLYTEAREKVLKNPAFCWNAVLYMDVWTLSICCFMIEDRFYGHPPLVAIVNDKDGYLSNFVFAFRKVWF